MLRPLNEESVLFLHVLRWLVLASVVGLLVGLTTTGFIQALTILMQWVETRSWGVWLLPLGLCLSGWLTTRVVPEAGGQGLERVVRAIHLHSGKITWQVIPTKIAATLLTLATGGSAGNVGPCVQIGSGLAAVIADYLRFDSAERKTLVICGLSAGFAAVFGAPMAGALFGMEALFVGSLAYKVLFPSAIASVVGYLVAVWAGIPSMNFQAHAFPDFDGSLLLLAVAGGFVFGFLALVFIECLNGVQRFADSLPSSVLFQGLLGGFLVLGVGYLVSFEVLGLGTATIQQALQGNPFLWSVFLGKMVTTSLTLRFGGSGGIILPICFVGATGGAVLGGLLNQDPSLFAALGLAGLLAGAINTPITAIILGLELFGLSSGPYLLLTCTVAFLLSGHRSAIPTQLLQLQKAPALQAGINQEIGIGSFGKKLWQESTYSSLWNWPEKMKKGLFPGHRNRTVAKTPTDQPPKSPDEHDRSSHP
ncbi:MAG: chloride channel protein [Nitrospirota bacterium]|nr:chloride channel protein [Nitrospirota bacterium]